MVSLAYLACIAALTGAPFAVAVTHRVTLSLESTSRSLRGRAVTSSRNASGDDATYQPSGIVANDFWAARDLLLVGYGAIFMKNDSDGALAVKDSAMNLAHMLPLLHPHAPCRGRIGSILSGDHDVNINEEIETIKAVADAAWACLPANFTLDDFEGSYTADMIGDPDKTQKGKMPTVKGTVALGACQKSLWPRTCSYWASLHTMAYRADVMQLGGAFLRAVIPIMASGATFCFGCTMHFRLLHQDVLTKLFLRDFDESLAV